MADSGNVFPLREGMGTTQDSETSSPASLFDKLKQTSFNANEYQKIADFFSEVENMLEKTSAKTDAKEILTSSEDNKTMAQPDKVIKPVEWSTLDRAVLWTILGIVIGLIGLMVAVVQLNITATQSIRDETLAKNNVILVEIQQNNEKVLNEIQGVRKEMQYMSDGFQQKLEMQDVKTENKIMKDRIERK